MPPELFMMVQVSADNIVITVTQQAHGFFCYRRAVHSGQSPKVELEHDPGITQQRVILHAHVDISFGMGLRMASRFAGGLK